MKPPVGTRRTREHVIADLGVCFVEWQALQCGYVVERMRHDYGIDLEMKTFNENGERERGDIHIQVKATDRLLLRPTTAAFSFRVARTNLVDWVYEVEPVILIVFDAKKKRGYWVCIQALFPDPEKVNFFAFGKTASIRVPVASRLNPNAMRKMARLRDEFRDKPRRNDP